MNIRARQYYFILLFIGMLVFYSLYEKTITTEKVRRKSKYGRHVVINITKNFRTLFDLTICNESDTQDLADEYLKHGVNANTNITDFRFQYNFSFEIEKSRLRPCPLFAPDLGPVIDDKAIWSLSGIEEMYSWIQPGGIYFPIECLALQEVAIIVPIHETRRLVFTNVYLIQLFIQDVLMSIKV